MIEGQRCSMCQAGEIRQSQGRLDQCGNTYLPTTVWTCDVCGFARYEAARDVPYRSSLPEPAVAPLALAPRKAA